MPHIAPDLPEGAVLSASQCTVPVAIPPGGTDLKEWLFAMSDGAWRACSPDHIAAAVSPGAELRLLLVQVLDGSPLVHRYAVEARTPSHLSLRSQSDLFHPLGQGPLDMTWDLLLEDGRLSSTLTARTTPALVALLAQEEGALRDWPACADAYLADTMPRLARNLEAMAGGGKPDTVPEPAPLEDRGAILGESACRAVIETPISSLDVSAWLFGLSEEDYRRCSTTHVSAGTSGGGEGRRLSINVEQPGSLLIQHYQEVVGESRHCRVVSPRSEVFLGERRSTLHVTWDLRLDLIDAGRTQLTNTVVVRTTPEFEGFLEAAGIPLAAAQASRGAIIAAHNAEETPGFARDMERKARLAAAAL
ncbi:MAG: hypothetical protein B7Y12_00650 [Rhizobiales bacterium 24-66-13]|nr:MAG: hypothetical protein B7Y95_04190 [Rhizobiales bacterium 32-66-11]OYY14022.1 MAG: hypothetical protein B7Y70_00135 [Rhizobiales bacterium 35-68-8]OYZ83112.1 MAG: hypothetical protein B7Y12_00650 [Rhizobiales bacterium 24-66-13]OZB12042.1 MAG: hypothetical protein B7X67_01235 [Rhizobiales bacterium 39-66-18]HQS45623.1 hypothetical protein [Xanthobacteraceae bacterium]